MKTKIEKLNDLYISSRQVGHTTAMLEGLRKVGKGIVVCINEHNKKYLQDNIISNNYSRIINTNILKNIRIFTLNQLDSMKGLSVPIVVDNASFIELAREVKELRNKLNIAQEKIQKLKQILEE